MAATSRYFLRGEDRPVVQRMKDRLRLLSLYQAGVRIGRVEHACAVGYMDTAEHRRPR